MEGNHYGINSYIILANNWRNVTNVPSYKAVIKSKKNVSKIATEVESQFVKEHRELYERLKRFKVECYNDYKFTFSDAIVQTALKILPTTLKEVSLLPG